MFNHKRVSHILCNLQLPIYSLTFHSGKKMLKTLSMMKGHSVCLQKHPTEVPPVETY